MTRVINWEFESFYPNFYNLPKSIPIIYENQIMFGTDSGYFYSLDKETSEVLWSVDARNDTKKGIISSPYIYKDRVYFGSYNGVLYCVDLKTGKIAWEDHLAGQIGSSPLVHNDVLYVGLEYMHSPQGEFIAYDINTNKKLWGRIYEELLHGSPVLCEKHNTLVIGTNDKTVDVYKIENGELVSSLKVGGDVKYKCALYNDYIISGSFDGCVYVSNMFDPEDMYGIKTLRRVYTTPLVHNDKLYFGSMDGTFYIIDLINKSLVNALQIKQQIVCPPNLINNRIVFGDVGGTMYVIDEIGNFVDTHKFNHSIVTKIIADEKNLFISFNNSSIISTPITF